MGCSIDFWQFWDFLRDSSKILGIFSLHHWDFDNFGIFLFSFFRYFWDFLKFASDFWVSLRDFFEDLWGFLFETFGIVGNYWHFSHFLRFFDLFYGPFETFWFWGISGFSKVFGGFLAIFMKLYFRGKFIFQAKKNMFLKG